MKLGVIIGPEEYEFAKVAKLGIPTIQLHLNCRPDVLTEERLENIRHYRQKYNIEISAAWLRWPPLRYTSTSATPFPGKGR